MVYTMYMQFCDYIQILGKYFEKGNNKGSGFIDVANLFLGGKDLLDVLYGDIDFDEQNKKIKQFYKYYYGIRKLPKSIARELLKNFDSQLFVQSLSQMPTNTKQGLCEDLRKYGIRVGEKSVDTICSDLYYKFLNKLTQGISECDNQIQNDSKTKTIKDYSKEAKAFCIEYSDYDELLPLCEIATKMHPLEKNYRKMYNDFKLLDTKQQKEVFELKEREFIKFDPNKIETLLKRYKEDLDKYNLSTRDFLYDGAKYFHRAFERYKDRLLADYNDRIYEKHMNLFDIDMPVDIGSYIVDYWENPQKNMLPPMDFMWEECNLGSCDEAKMVFYVNNFIMWSIIIICNKTKPFGFSHEHFLEDYHQTTFEDRYYYVLYLLTIAYS